MKTIVSEYLANVSVYDNLPPAEFADEEETDSGKLTTNSAGSSGMEDQRIMVDNKPQNTVSFNEQDTIIDGHKAKVLTRKEVQYE